MGLGVVVAVLAISALMMTGQNPSYPDQGDTIDGAQDSSVSGGGSAGSPRIMMVEPVTIDPVEPIFVAPAPRPAVSPASFTVKNMEAPNPVMLSAIPHPTEPSAVSTNASSSSTVIATTSPEAAEPIAPQPLAPVAISISGFAYVPSQLSIPRGTTVTWTNNDSGMIHTISADSSEGQNMGLLSRSLAKGNTFSFTFDKVGTFSYHCAVHATLRGTVTVTD
jgi:plastocyanin